MATRITSLNNPQEMTVVVSGPEDANRLIICTGDAPLNIYGSPNSNVSNSFTFLVGPVLTRRQFVRAVASAGITKNAFNMPPNATAGISVDWSILSTDADWDDESGQVEVRVEARVAASASVTATLNGISYNVSILAAVPEA